MASTTTDPSVLYERRPVKLHRYQWPGVQLNVWILVMLVAAGFMIGAFATFITIQEQLDLPIPWFVISAQRYFALCFIYFTWFLHFDVAAPVPPRTS